VWSKECPKSRTVVRVQPLQRNRNLDLLIQVVKRASHEVCGDDVTGDCDSRAKDPAPLKVPRDVAAPGSSSRIGSTPAPVVGIARGASQGLATVY
jgi:hypothetical protein